MLKIKLTARRLPPPWQHPDPPSGYALTIAILCSARNQAHTPAATENLVPYSRAQPAIFKTAQLQPVKDLKLLVRDYAVSRSHAKCSTRVWASVLIVFSQPIAKNALAILINVSSDPEVLKLLAEDDAFLETILSRITVCQLA